MRILFIGYDYIGHSTPAKVFQNALKNRNHQISYLSFKVPDDSPAILSVWLARFQDQKAFQNAKIDLETRIFCPDLIISELPILGAAEFCKQKGIPWVVFNALPMIFRYEDANLFLQASLPEFEDSKDHGNLHFIGPVVRKSAGKPVNFGKKRPYIHVTQGTVAKKDQFLIEAAKKACKSSYYLISEAIEHYLYMENLDLFITNGGFGGVSLAIYHGTPIICAGETEDKPFVAARVAKTGIGVNLGTAKPEVADLKAAIERCLSDSRMEDRCMKLSEKAKTYDLNNSIDLVESLCRV